jgi:rod shape determining protein RodA
MENDKFWKGVDLTLLFSAAVLIAFGSAAIYSASNGVGSLANFHKHIYFNLSASMIALVVVYFLPYRFFQDWSYVLYGISILGLVAVLVLGRRVGGEESRFSIGSSSFQPSEITKVTTVLALANFLSSKNTNVRTLKDFAIAVGIVLLPTVLIRLQPDTGTALVFLAFILPVILVAGFDYYLVLVLAVPPVLALIGFINIYALAVFGAVALIILFASRRNIFISIISVLGGVGLGILSNYYAVRLLKPHQLKRISTFLDPTSDPQGAGYNALQAKIAIGSGGFFGKGFLKGSQTQLRFIPAQWTDFIFCVIGEEFGFFGCFIVLTAYLVFVLRLITLTEVVKSRYALLVITGFASILMTHLIVNIGMTIGLMPVIGITLPFLSYGGSSLLANVIMLGIILNFYRNRRNHSFSS